MKASVCVLLRAATVIQHARGLQRCRSWVVRIWSHFRDVQQMALSYGAHIALFRLLLKEFPSSATDTVDHISHLMLESGTHTAWW